MKWFAFTLVLLIAPLHVFAQEAPTGAHYASRASDTGHGGTSVNATGTFPASVPLELPQARGGLSVPLQIVYSGRGAGAAGVGWDIPLSYIKRDSTFAHRRPAFTSQNIQPRARESVYLSLLGQGYDLIKRSDEWIARTGTFELKVVESQGTWYVFDGQGRTYTFLRAEQLGDNGLWLLKSVNAPGGVYLELTYQTNVSRFNGGEGVEINLTRITYNSHPAMGCAKNEVELTYRRQSDAPLSLSVFGDKVLLRQLVLERVDVISRSTCSSSPLRLRRYVFNYTSDPDTMLPRLREVRQHGREGTPEWDASLPVASYDYGTAAKNGKLTYRTSQQINLPSDDQSSTYQRISSTTTDSSVSAPGSGEKYSMWHTLTDLTGDGRPDLIFKKGDKLWMSRNRPAPDGKTALSGPTGMLHDNAFKKGAVSTYRANKRRLWWGSASSNTVNVWRQAIDVNGDGRIDIIDAAEQSEHWIIYLNTPGPTGIKWERRSFWLKRLRNELEGAGHELPGGYIPLARRTTGVTVRTVMCLKLNGQVWLPFDGTLTKPGVDPQGNPTTLTFKCDEGHPTHIPVSPPVCDPEHPGLCQPPVGIEPERTFTEWELSDLNGDGYPDFVFNSSPVDFSLIPTKPPLPILQTEIYWIGDVEKKFGVRDSNEIRAAFNVAGVRFNDDERFAFSQPVVLETSRSGVGLWQGVDMEGETQRQEVGFADVNGDGLVDRVHAWYTGNNQFSARAYLGVYSGNRWFSDVYIAVPGAVSRQYSPQKKQKCAATPKFYESFLNEGLRDLTGDGIPDFYSGNRVSIGTGAGFTSPIAVDSDVRLVYSHQTESCYGEYSNNDGGMFDIDGDGKPEIVGIVAGSNPGQLAYNVSELAGGSAPGSPEAGKLTMVDNGYGAITRINYVSAKDHPEGGHQVPFPEVVVSSVSTTGSLNLGGNITGSHYAYGGAELVFDSALDRFVFPGYQRFVDLRIVGPSTIIAPPPGMATVTATWPLMPFVPGMSKKDRWLRMQRVGRVQDVFLVRNAGTNPWSLLDIEAGDGRTMGVTHHEWDARFYESTDPTGSFQDCMDMINPYDFQRSLINNATNGLNVCRSHGFAFGLSKQSWYGPRTPPNDNNIQTRSTVKTVDDFGRVTYAEYEGDLFRGDDDICVESTFATPNGLPRVLNALAARRVLSCDGEMTIAKESYEYDHLSWGAVSDGRVTSHSIERRSTNTGELLKTIRAFDATYDSVGNVKTVRTQRGSATRTVSFEYDPFGLAPVYSRVDASGVAATGSFVSYDLYSLAPLIFTDEHQTQWRSVFDGFGRLIQSTVTPAGGNLGVTSTVSYQGFSQPEASGRRVVSKEFPNAVPPGQVATSASRTATAFLDELGRVRRADVNLGADYANQILVVGSRTYDDVGRVVFEADPYPNNQDAAKAYGTTYHFSTSGDLECAIRGRGKQPLNKTTDVAAERFPTCYQRYMVDHRDTIEVRDPSALMPQGSGVVRRIVSTALGRVVERSTVRNDVRLDYATFAHDSLGQQRAITRSLKPATGGTPVFWWWELDSLGQTLSVSEPQTVQRSYSYSDWGEPVEARWIDGGIERAVRGQFDSLGRLTRVAEFHNGIEDDTTVKKYEYDVGVNASSHVSPTFVLGRLARASTPEGSVSFSYDAFGRVNGRTFSDGDGQLFVEKPHYFDDGRLGSIEFNLPDRNYQDEQVSYSYDSAGRLRSMNYSDSSGPRELYRTRLTDPFGRVRKATYGGNTDFSATYADEGRRLIQEVAVVSPHGSRKLKSLEFDELGRELSRTEEDGVNSATTKMSYDSLSRVVSLTKRINNNPVAFWRFGYDALGNVNGLYDFSGEQGATLMYQPTGDLDRVCRIEYGTSGSGSTECNLGYDGLGNVVNQPTRTGTRQLSYFLRGDVRTIHEGNIHAGFKYDAFGKVQQLDVQGSAQDKRRDRRFGSLIEQREVSSGGSTASVLIRRIPGPGGIIASRRGSGNEWVFEFGELRGNRFFTDQNGAFIQRVDYNPFGEAKSTGEPTGSAKYTSHQWNKRDSLGAFGLSHLGARVYDPVIGRFLSRDRLVVPRTSARTNPYAFASNNPITSADPTGLDEDLETVETANEYTGLFLDATEHATGAGIEVLDFMQSGPLVRTGWLGDLHYVSSGVGWAADGLGVGIKVVQFAADPSVETGLDLEREVAETGLSMTGWGLVLVWSIKGAEAAIGKERIGGGLYWLGRPIGGYAHERYERKLEQDSERYAQVHQLIRRMRYISAVVKRRYAVAEAMDAACGSIPRPAECVELSSSQMSTTDRMLRSTTGVEHLMISSPDPPKVSKPGYGKDGSGSGWQFPIVFPPPVRYDDDERPHR